MEWLKLASYVTLLIAGCFVTVIYVVCVLEYVVLIIVGVSFLSMGVLNIVQRKELVCKDFPMYEIVADGIEFILFGVTLIALGCIPLRYEVLRIVQSW
jgi:hypothetical protein